MLPCPCSGFAPQKQACTSSCLSPSCQAQGLASCHISRNAGCHYPAWVSGSLPQVCCCALQKGGADAFILDLRNNPGGLVRAGLDIARLWLPGETAVLNVEGRDVEGQTAVVQARASEGWAACRPPRLLPWPIALPEALPEIERQPVPLCTALVWPVMLRLRT